MTACIYVCIQVADLHFNPWFPPPTPNQKYPNIYMYTYIYICIHTYTYVYIYYSLGGNFLQRTTVNWYSSFIFKPFINIGRLKSKPQKRKAHRHLLVKPRIPWLPLLHVHTKHDFSVWCQESKTQAKEIVGHHYFTATPWPQTHRLYHKMQWISAFCLSQLKPESRFKKS
jgi:hypothetical protein